MNRLQIHRKRAVTGPALAALARLSRSLEYRDRKVVWLLTGQSRNIHMTTDEIAAAVKVPVWMVDRIKDDQLLELQTLSAMVDQAMKLATDLIILDRGIRRLEEVLEHFEAGDVDTSQVEASALYLRTKIAAGLTKFVDSETLDDIERGLSPRVCAHDREPATTPDLVFEAGGLLFEEWAVDDLPQLRATVEKCRLVADMMRNQFNFEAVAEHV